MKFRGYPILLATVVSMACAGPKSGKKEPSALIASDNGGAPGYQHVLERSRFVIGPQGRLRRFQEHGFTKVVGPEGTFATDLRNGLVIAIQAGGANKDEATAAATTKPGSITDPNK